MRGQKNSLPVVPILLFLLSAIIVIFMIGSWIFSIISWSPGPAPAHTAAQETLTPFLPLASSGTAANTIEPRPAETLTPTGTPTPVLTPTHTHTPLPTPTTTPAVDPWVDSLLAVLTLSQKIGQMIMTGVDEKAITPTTCQLIQQTSPGAIVYRKVNADSPDQLRQFSAALQECAQSAPGIPLFIAIDHEGQYVTRFESGVTVFPAALAQGATGGPGNAYRVSLAASQELAFSGINMVLGPVADVLMDYDNTVISQRSFGGDPQQVGLFVAQSVMGYIQGGVTPVLKHFPGHGGVSGDSHYTQPVDTADIQAVENFYLPPFIAGLEAGAPVVMFSHVVFPSIDESEQPASISGPTVRLLRDGLSFQGIVLTDSMGMGAITGRGLNVPEASVKAVLAGVDILLITSPQLARGTHERLLLAVQHGEIPVEMVDDAVRRILTVKSTQGLKAFPIQAAPPPDWAANANLAYEVGYRSVLVLRDDADLVPLSPEMKSILIVGPTDGWGLYPVLTAALQDHGYAPQVIIYSNPWNGAVPEQGYLQTLPAQAAQHDLVMMLTWEAHLNRMRFGDSWQAQLVNQFLSGDYPVIIVALKSPTDIIEFPHAPAYLATLGTNQGQIQALADILVSRWNPTGLNPLPGIP